MSGSASGTGLIPTGAAGSNGKMTAGQVNALARASIFRTAKPILQRVGSKSFTNVAAGNNVFQVNPLQIGFVRRFFVEIVATISNTDTSHAAALTSFGADNILQNLTFNDFTGNPRHNCSGRSLSFVEAAKYRMVPSAAYTTDSVSGYGSIVASNVAPAISASSSQTVRRIFEVPIMVDCGQNMAGGLWLGTNNQSTTLNITLNPSPIGLPGTDPLNFVYQLAAGGTTISATPITSATVTVYQDYWNNVPSDKNGDPILPQLDLSTAYMITETNSGMTFAANQQSAWNFPTFSKLLGTYLIYDNGAAALNPGTDLTQLALVVSNYSNIKQYDPYLIDRLARNVINASFPSGSYGFITRDHPLDVNQYPALQLQVTPSSANSGSYMMLTTELLRPVQYMAAASGMGGT
jgi:hypothetical protein